MPGVPWPSPLIPPRERDWYARIESKIDRLGTLTLRWKRLAVIEGSILLAILVRWLL